MEKTLVRSADGLGPANDCGLEGDNVIRIPDRREECRIGAGHSRHRLQDHNVGSQPEGGRRSTASELGRSARHSGTCRGPGLARRQAEQIRHLGVDEKPFTRGHHYFTLVNDLDRPCSVYRRGV